MLSFEANKTNSAGPLAPKIQVDGCCWQLIYVATRAATNRYSLEFWHSDSIRLQLVFIYMEFMLCVVKITLEIFYRLQSDL